MPLDQKVKLFLASAGSGEYNLFYEKGAISLQTMSTEAAGGQKPGEMGNETPEQEGHQEAPFEGVHEEPELSPEERLAGLDESLRENEGEVADLTKRIEERRAELAKVREELGLPPADDLGLEADTERLEELRRESEELHEKKEEELTLQDLNDLLKLLKKLSPEEQQEIMKTGRSREGRPLRTDRGEVNPDVAKKIAEAAFKGIKEITTAMIKAFIALAGVLAGIITGGKGGETGEKTVNESSPKGKS